MNLQHKTKKMKTEFKLVGLSAPRSFTCRTDEKENIFWVSSHMLDDRYKSMFKWAKSADDFWEDNWRIEVEHDGFYKDGTPINPTAVSIRVISKIDKKHYGRAM